MTSKVISQPISPNNKLEEAKVTHSEVMDKIAVKITNQNAKEWVENHLFADVKIAMKNLIDYI